LLACTDCPALFTKEDDFQGHCASVHQQSPDIRSLSLSGNGVDISSDKQGNLSVTSKTKVAPYVLFGRALTFLILLVSAIWVDYKKAAVAQDRARRAARRKPLPSTFKLKEPLNAFQLYAQDKRDPGKGSDQLNDIMRIWRALPQSERDVYEKKYKQDMQRYQSEIRRLKQTAQKQPQTQPSVEGSTTAVD